MIPSTVQNILLQTSWSIDYWKSSKKNQRETWRGRSNTDMTSGRMETTHDTWNGKHYSRKIVLLLICNIENRVNSVRQRNSFCICSTCNSLAPSPTGSLRPSKIENTLQILSRNTMSSTVQLFKPVHDKKKMKTVQSYNQFSSNKLINFPILDKFNPSIENILPKIFPSSPRTPSPPLQQPCPLL